MQFALINNSVVENVIEVDDEKVVENFKDAWQYVIDITSTIPSPGIGWRYEDSTFIQPEDPDKWILSVNNLHKRFPITSNGISTKYDLATLFLTDIDYANSLVVNGADLYSIKLLLLSAAKLISGYENINLKSNILSDYLNIFSNASLPEAFRLTQLEVDYIKNTPAKQTG